jgi:hypothetical protein
MFSRVIRSLPLCAAGLLILPAGALAHAVCGDRVFPATLGIDDPGVNDELSIPTVAYQPTSPSGQQELDLGAFSWSKTITPNVGIVISDGATWQHPGGFGRDALSTELQWGNFCSADHELMATLSFNVDWAGTGTGSQTQPFNTYQPVLDVGKGFGDLPKSLNPLRPLALTGEVSETFPGQSRTNGSPNATTLNGGFTLQYSLPYYNSHVAAINNDFVNHLIPITEFTFSRPVSGFVPGTNPTTGTVQPGVIYIAAEYQVGLEAIVPLNNASGHGVGVVFSVDLYLDDILPNSLGRPLFGGARPLFGAPQ